MPAGRTTATGLWYVAPGRAELREIALGALQEGEALVRATHSGVSRGTERLVFSGLVPASEFQRMRAPMQRGDFPFPVQYGYCAVGVVEAGPAEVLGKPVFCLHPHQDFFRAPLSMRALGVRRGPGRSDRRRRRGRRRPACWLSQRAPARGGCVVGRYRPDAATPSARFGRALRVAR